MATGKTTPLMLMTCLSPLKGIYTYVDIPAVILLYLSAAFDTAAI